MNIPILNDMFLRERRVGCRVQKYRLQRRITLYERLPFRSGSNPSAGSGRSGEIYKSGGNAVGGAFDVANDDGGNRANQRRGAGSVGRVLFRGGKLPSFAGFRAVVLS